MPRPDLRLLLPAAADRYAGPRLAVWFLALYNVVGTVRSLIHILAPDSGAQSIATMNTAVAGGTNIIGLLAQWGGAQLLMALTIGQYKHLVTMGTPPGDLSWVAAPLCAVVLVISLVPTRPAAEVNKR